MRVRFIVLLLIVWIPQAAAADYLEPYRRGFNAFNLFRWEATVTEMRKAIAENPVESGKDVHIQLLAYKPYVPHFYLGIALAKLDRCDEAIPALRESLRQGQLPKTRGYWQRAENTLGECLRKTPEPAPQPPVVIATKEEPPPVVKESEPEVQRPAETIAQLPPPPVTRNEEPAVDTTRAEPEPIRRPPPAPATETASALLTAPRPTAAIPTVSEPPAALVSAVDAYLRGRYADAIRILDGLRLTDPRDRAHAFLFRSAARYALFTIGQRRDANLGEQAKADLGEYKRLRPRSSLDPRVFSPAFVAFAEAAR
jgi:hypothetical protein